MHWADSLVQNCKNGGEGSDSESSEGELQDNEVSVYQIMAIAASPKLP